MGPKGGQTGQSAPTHLFRPYPHRRAPLELGQLREKRAAHQVTRADTDGFGPTALILI